jgi:hypothetical protein
VSGFLTVGDVIAFWHEWLERQGLFTYEAKEAGARKIVEDADYWSGQSMWNLYNAVEAE